MDIMEQHEEEIVNDIKGGRLTISIIGLGRMGLPIACLFADTGAKVIGVDINKKIVDLINNGKSPISGEGLEPLIEKYSKNGRLYATDRVNDATSKSDVIAIVVPTLIDEETDPDYTAVEKACKEIGLGLKKGSLVIFQSTVGPGETEELVKTILEKTSGLKAGKDFGLAYSPIRATAGRVMKDIQNYPRIVAGVDDRSLRATKAVMGTISKEIKCVSNIKTAEAEKLFENVYRDVNIALVNELAIFCEKIGIDRKEVKKVANTQPYSHLHDAGVGVGGHCIPVNPYFLVEKADNVGVKVNLVKIARKINDYMPEHTAKIVIKALRDHGKSLRRAKIAIFGISYKSNVGEARNSPAQHIIDFLKKKGIEIVVYDPYFTKKEFMDLGYESAEKPERATENADCILITVAHDEFKKINFKDLARVMKKPGAIIDGCRVLNPLDVKKQGLSYYGIGYGGR